MKFSFSNVEIFIDWKFLNVVEIFGIFGMGLYVLVLYINFYEGGLFC